MDCTCTHMYGCDVTLGCLWRRSHSPDTSHNCCPTTSSAGESVHVPGDKMASCSVVEMSRVWMECYSTYSAAIEIVCSPPEFELPKQFMNVGVCLFYFL